MPSTRKKRRLLTLTALLAMAAIAFALWPREPRLLDRATRITSTAGWAPDQHYFWTDDDQVLFRRIELMQIVPPNAYPPDDFSIYRYRRSTGVSELHVELTALFKEHNVGLRDGELTVSPDGRWIYAENGITCRADGTSVIAREEISFGRSFWTADSRRLLSAYYRMEKDRVRGFVVVLPVTEEKIEREVPTPYFSRSPYEMIQEPDYHRAVVTEDGYVLVPLADENSNAQDTLRRWKLFDPAPKFETIRLAPPRDMTIRSISLSPQRDRIAYVVSGTPHAPFPGFVYRLLPFVKPPGSVEAIWVSRRDGSEMREIGSVATGHLTGLQWLPGSHRLSFLHAAALYTVEAP